MEHVVAGSTGKWTRWRSWGFALCELGRVLWAWATGEGDLASLLISWLEVISGQVSTE
jgi:hypothetical protein